MLILVEHSPSPSTELNGVTDLAEYKTDTDRSGASNATDILRVIDLLNGAGAYDPYLNAVLPE